MINILENDYLKKEHSHLVKEIDELISIVGPCESSVLLSEIRREVSEDTIPELYAVRTDMIYRETCYSIITSFFVDLTEEQLYNLTTQKDTDLEAAAMIVRNHTNSLLGEKNQVNSILYPLKQEDLRKINKVFYPREEEHILIDREYHNNDVDEEFLSEDEIKAGWGEDMTSNSLNRISELNVHKS